MSEPRVATIEGHKVLVVERHPPLPATLDVLLARMTITLRAPIRITGWRATCSDQDHRLVLFAEGRYRGSDGVLRDLRLMQCADCESVCLRDITHDRLAGLPKSSLAVRRRDHVLGWYSGARRNQRQYR